jgi:NAD(P)-dependent dehydrogenase (short-subunit alcohol dehydrogenase family)
VLEALGLMGKIAIVTGAGRGLGKAMAQAGAQVVCTARTQEQIYGTVSEITSKGSQAIAVQTDVVSSAQIDALGATCIEQYGQLNIMLANASGGVASDHDLWEFAYEEFEAVLGLNLKSTFYSDRAASKVMMERGEGGVIINVTSRTALRGNRVFTYSTAKGGMVSLTKSKGTILWLHNILANVI